MVVLSENIHGQSRNAPREEASFGVTHLAGIPRIHPWGGLKVHDAKLQDTIIRKVIMEIVIMLFVLVGGSIAYSAWKKNKSPGSIQPVNNNNDLDNDTSVRKCLSCGYEGKMKTWISNYNAPKFIIVAGFLLGYLPGLIFLVIYWGKYKCQSCGSVGKNQPIGDADPVTKQKI